MALELTPALEPTPALALALALEPALALALALALAIPAQALETMPASVAGLVPLPAASEAMVTTLADATSVCARRECPARCLLLASPCAAVLASTSTSMPHG
jgi:hypothetical protein